jgi:hypothetical protein
MLQQPSRFRRLQPRQSRLRLACLPERMDGGHAGCRAVFGDGCKCDRAFGERTICSLLCGLMLQFNRSGRLQPSIVMCMSCWAWHS